MRRGQPSTWRARPIVLAPSSPLWIDEGIAFWLRHESCSLGMTMISQSRVHLAQAGEGYWQHFRFATTFGLLAMAAAIAALLHALVPALCTHTASRIIRHLGQLMEDRSRIDAIESEAVEARAFVLLLLLATGVVAPLWFLGAPLTLKLAYTVLAYALPAVLMITNPELTSSNETAA